MVDEPIAPRPRVRVLAEIAGPGADGLAYYWLCEGCEDALARGLPQHEAHLAARRHEAQCADLERARRFWRTARESQPIGLTPMLPDEVNAAMARHPAGSGRHPDPPPVLAFSELTDRVYLVTKYVRNGAGALVAFEKRDVTDELTGNGWTRAEAAG